ncbi:M20 family metallopeptidase [Virgibacillus halodenitrificans]|uniref:M20 family metallopeptidase n=1 Tax=Virgibacillus halodenitrificans TaxID=1482 RepID=A0ABR7VRA0_VIRHA|nr:M20 family metallopeptidase [Virgibacillus halodenitrificans]MBD1223866.1 M20 family metallopeptidase [Virgibacillus halodenitrificans]
MDHIKKYMEVNQQRILEDIKLLVESDSPSINKELTDKCKANIQLLFQRYFGYKATEIKQQKYGDHLRFEFGDGEETLLLLSHFDTVWDKGDLKYKVKGNKVYGPGILDMKAGLVQAIWALKACKDLGLSLNKKIVFLCTSDEELGSPTSKLLIEKEALNSKVVLVTEPPVAETGALKTARKGSSRYMVDIKGKAAHAGNHHRDGRSAIKEAAHLIIYLEELTNYTTGTTVNVGTVKGGGKLNVVPDSATFGVNVRVKTMKEQKRLDQLIRHLEPRTEGVTLKVKGKMNRPPMVRSNRTGKLFHVAKHIAKDLDFDLEEASVGGGSDGNFTANLGVPTLDGLGAVGEGIHARNEHILASEIPERATLLCKLITTL